MNSKIMALDESDRKARYHIFKSLEICDSHALSRKLINRLSAAKGPLFAIADELVELELLRDYDDYVLRSATSPDVGFDFSKTPDGLIVEFVRDYLSSIERAVVLSENWGAEPGDVDDTWLSGYRPPRVAFFGASDVYHYATSEMQDREELERTVITRHQWQTTICSCSPRMPKGDKVTLDEALIDELVKNCKHVFVPAFDGSGFLLWTVVD